MRHRWFLVAVTILCILSIGAETSSCESREPAPTTRPVPVLDNRLASGQLQIQHELSGESFRVVTEYHTDYDTSQWRVTDAKTLWMRARAEPLSTDQAVTATVLVEHVHADVALRSKYALMDGWKQDSMDDSVHGAGAQPGFWINPPYVYEEVFAIEGFSQTLIEGWEYYTGSYTITGDQTRLTEENIVKVGGVYANKIQVVYDLMIRYAGESFFHTRSIVDEFLIPVSGATTSAAGQ